jgi:sec-independent protein translocase protein TatB
MDNIFGIGLPELFFIAILALIILGPERLPSTFRQIARYWGYMRNLGRELTSQFSEEFKALEDLNPRKLLNEMADEELAKEAKAKPPTTKPATNTTASTKPPATKSTTTTSSTASKPASSTASSTANKSTTTAKKTTTKPTPAAGQKANTGTDKPATESAAASTTGAENTILPPPQEEASAPSTTTNGDAPQLPKDSPALPPAEDAKTEPQMMISVAPASLNGNADSAEKEA